MSKRILDISLRLVVTAVLVVGLLLVCNLSVVPVTPYKEKQSMFASINDLPVITTLDSYYQLIRKGWTTVTFDGAEYTIWLQDFNTEERRILQLMLRTP